MSRWRLCPDPPRLTSSHLECLGVGLDVGTWIHEGLIDIVCPMLFFFTDWQRMMGNMAEWSELTQGSKCSLYPTIHAWRSRITGGHTSRPPAIGRQIRTRTAEQIAELTSAR